MSDERKKKQWMIFSLGAGAIFVVGYIVFGLLGPKTPEPVLANVPGQEIDITVVSDRTSAAAPEMSWITTSRKEIRTLTELVKSLEAKIEANNAAHQKEIADLERNSVEMIEQFAMRVGEIEEGQISPASQTQPVPQTPNYTATGSEFIQERTGQQSRRASNSEPAPAETTAPAKRTFGHVIELARLETEETSFTSLDHYLPAGSYASAVVISGADAPTNVRDRQDPIPVLLRVTGPAFTAARGKARPSSIDITGCTVQGSAIGDLSSERVKIRLVSLTCMGPNNSVFEKTVKGYVVGMGKQGVRGRVVSREGNAVTNAAIAGALEGLGGAVSSLGAAGTSGGEMSPELLAQTAAASAAGGGLNSATSTLSQYYIDRAEQYQPVVVMNSGTEVEIVFMEGVSFQ